MTERVIVTAALPYANGSIHIGHLVEYCHADMYVRALTRLGTEALYICANDAHGTPIEVNAARRGIAPEALAAHYHDEHQRDFARFDIRFDHFGTTHSETNRAIVEDVYEALRQGGHIEDRKVDGNWCEHDKRFLPDRYIRGECPRCGATDQYGDVCEVCGSTHAPTDLKNPRCALCGHEPRIKQSEHVFFKLSAAEHVDFLRAWIDSGALQKDVANYVRNWIDTGLRDWCISRDGPYFGFAIPDRPGKFFYVWLDAPFGYASSSSEWGVEHGIGFDALWRSDTTRIEHIIGKDIVYFHTLFWPAVLRAVGYTLPSRVHVHGMLTVDGEKMSKSRGTFINASTFADSVDPQALRYYYACKYSAQSDDLDLSLTDFVQRVNGELVNKHANLFSRVSQFLCQKLDGRLGDLPFAPEAAQDEPTGDGTPLDLARQVVGACRRIEDLYRQRELGHVMRELSAVADVGNEFFQARKPWEQLKTDPEAARLTCTFAVNVCHALAMYLWPVVPRFCDAAAAIIDGDISRMATSELFKLRNKPIGSTARLFERIERKQVDAMVAASQGPQNTSEPSPAADASTAAPTSTAAQISYDEFQKLDLRVGTVRVAEPVRKSKKLLRLEVDLGEAESRQIVAGIAQAYDPAALVGTQVVVVANLKPAKLMGVQSRGMVLAGEDGQGLAVLRLDRDLPNGTVVR